MAEATKSEELALESIVVQIVDEFQRRQKQGESPDIEEYAAQHPEAADLIRKVLASLQLIDQVRQDDNDQEDSPIDGSKGTLGDFRLLREVGRGGMGIVYEAEQISLGRRVALKVLPFAATMDPRHLQRFQNEARAAATLQHPHIVPVYAVGQERGVHYYAMQFIEGQTLAEIIRDLTQNAAGKRTDEAESKKPTGPSDPTEDYLDVPDKEFASPETETKDSVVARKSTLLSITGKAYFEQVARLGIQAAEALEHAHQLGIVHRDIKPGNLMIDGQGQLWVTDFGLARIDSNANLTTSGDLLGTLRYMSPEQALAKKGVVDHRTDVYSLGATLYEMITLQPIVRGEERQEILRKIACEEPRKIRQVNKATPIELETIVLKALEKDPADRYPSSQALAEDLRRHIDDRPIQAQRPGSIKRILKWARRHPSIIRMGAVTVFLTMVILLAASIMLTSAYRSEAEQRLKAQDAAKNEARHRKIAERARMKFESNLYLANMQLAHQAWKLGHMGRVLELLEKHRPRNKSDSDLRGWEWYYLKAQCRRDVVTIEHPTLFQARILWSPDGECLATTGTGNSRVIGIWRPTTGKNVANLRGNPRSQNNVASWSADGKYLASASTGSDQIEIWDAGTWETKITLDSRRSTWQLAWSPVDNKLASLHSSVLQIWDIDTGKVISQLWQKNRIGKGPTIPWRFYSGGLAWNPAGDCLAVSGRESKGRKRFVKILNTTTWNEVGTFTLPKGHSVYSIQWCNDGSRIRINRMVFDVQTGKQVQMFSNSGVRSPDGRRIAMRSITSPQMISIRDADTGEEVYALKGHSSSVRRYAWRPDGRQLASITTDGEIKIWDVSKHPEYQAIDAHQDEISCVAWRPDGRRIVTVGRDKKLKVWELGNTNASVILEKDMVSTSSVFWSPDGGFLAWHAPGDKINLWNVSENKNGHIQLKNVQYPGVSTVPGPISWSPDGKYLLTKTRDFSIRICDVTTRKEIRSIANGDFYKGLWSPTGKHVAIRGSVVHLWDAHSWRELPPLPCLLGTSGLLVWSSEGDRLAITRNNKIEIWDVVKRQIDSVLRGHGNTVRSLAWSPDGKRIVSASHDQSIKIWDTESGQNLLTLGSNALQVAWSPDGKRIVSGHQDGTVRIWDASPGFHSQKPPSREKSPGFRLEAAELNAELATAFSEISKHQEAEVAFQKSVSLFQGLIAEYPELPLYKYRLIQAYLQFGAALDRAEKTTEAINIYREALALEQEVQASFPHEVYNNISYLHYLLGMSLVKEKEFDNAKVHFHEVGKSANAKLLNDSAWMLATSEHEALRDAELALQLAEKAVQIKPKDRFCQNTLGVALYRKGDWSKAVTALETSMEYGQGGDSFDFFFLAMAEWRRGNKNQAQLWYSQAVSWMDKNKANDEELRRIRTEAAQLLGIEKAKKKTMTP